MAVLSKPRDPAEVRLALPEELTRIALVASAGFYFSPANKYERPKRDDYPEDTFYSYYYQLLNYLVSEKCILIVIDDEYKRSEDEDLYAALRAIYGGKEWTKKEGRLPVGFACLTLKVDSFRYGKFQPEGDAPDTPDDDEISRRDQNQEGMDKLMAAIEPSMNKYFGGEFTVDMIAVHPAYWRRGNGTLLLRWTAKLADADHIPLGIASVPMGIKISRNVGFEKKEEIDVKGYSEHPENFMVWIGVREPGALPSIPKSHETWASWMFNTVTAFFWKRDR